MKTTLLSIKRELAYHPIHVTVGLVLALTLFIGTVIGMLDHQQAFADTFLSHPTRH